jgi:predicted SAM-dependent methyltransferase
MARKLHIGCGHYKLDGWINTDLEPISKDVVKLDATKPFPYESNSFDYIFSEHMIEHINYIQGINMLGECNRILKPNGRIRISTPDLQFLTRLYREPEKDIHRHYISWFTTVQAKWAPTNAPAFVFNAYMRNWGHQFVYDETTLTTSLLMAGFYKIRRTPLNVSDDPELQDLEHADRLPPGLLELETMTLEAANIRGAQ